MGMSITLSPLWTFVKAKNKKTKKKKDLKNKIENE